MRNIIKNVFKRALFKALSASIATLVVYQFFYVEFIRSSVEDAAFDVLNSRVLSKKMDTVDAPNIFVLNVDDKYLRSKKLLDENNETTYGYIFPRENIAEIIQKVDALVDDLDEENYPKALFIDYDFSYYSDPLNVSPSVGDMAFLDLLKKDRPYIIYLPLVANHHIVYRSKDIALQRHLKEGKIKLVSVGLTTASDGVSRRYYPFEVYKDNFAEDRGFVNVAIKLWNEEVNATSVKEKFNQDGMSFIENRIIFKDKKIDENGEYITWQSNWKNLSGMSANAPLDMIYEDDLRDAVIMIGATHSLSTDNFTNSIAAKMTGVEMHANALMTLNYLDGKLKRLGFIYTLLIVFGVVYVVDVFSALLFLFLNRSYLRSVKVYRTLLSSNFKESLEAFQEKGVFLTSILVLLFGISYYLLMEYQLWFNWMIPTLMSFPFIVWIFILRKLRKI